MVTVSSIVVFDVSLRSTIESCAELSDLWAGLELKNSNQLFSQAKKSESWADFKQTGSGISV